MLSESLENIENLFDYLRMSPFKLFSFVFYQKVLYQIIHVFCGSITDSMIFLGHVF